MTTNGEYAEQRKETTQKKPQISKHKKGFWKHRSFV